MILRTALTFTFQGACVSRSLHRVSCHQWHLHIYVPQEQPVSLACTCETCLGSFAISRQIRHGLCSAFQTCCLKYHGSFLIGSRTPSQVARSSPMCVYTQGIHFLLVLGSDFCIILFLSTSSTIWEVFLSTLLCWTRSFYITWQQDLVEQHTTPDMLIQICLKSDEFGFFLFVWLFSHSFSCSVLR